MNLRDIPRALSPIGWIVGAAILALIVMAVWWFMFRQPADNKAQAKQGEVTGALNDARSKSAAEATETIVRRGDANAAGDKLSEETRDVIRNTPGADQRVPDGLNAAGLGRLCLRPANRGRPECVQLARPQQPPQAR